MTLVRVAVDLQVRPSTGYSVGSRERGQVRPTRSGKRNAPVTQLPLFVTVSPPYAGIRVGIVGRPDDRGSGRQVGKEDPNFPFGRGLGVRTMDEVLGEQGS